MTPLDIHNKEFTRSFRGYNEEEVDEFLDLIVAELEWYMRKTKSFQANIAGLESRINHYKGLEETSRTRSCWLRRQADQIKESATRRLMP